MFVSFTKIVCFKKQTIHMVSLNIEILLSTMYAQHKGKQINIHYTFEASFAEIPKFKNFISSSYIRKMLRCMGISASGQKKTHRKIVKIIKLICIPNKMCTVFSNIEKKLCLEKNNIFHI